MLPMTGKFLLLGLLGMGWILFHRRVTRLNEAQPFHVAAHERDCRKARFYYQSVWVGLVSAFISFLSLEALAQVTFDSSLEREWVLSIVRGVGLWGLIIAALVWSQVGMRVSRPNSDGQSLTTLPDQHRDRF